MKFLQLEAIFVFRCNNLDTLEKTKAKFEDILDKATQVQVKTAMFNSLLST